MLCSMAFARLTFKLVIYQEDQEQLAAANLGPFDNERTALAQLGVRFKKQLLFLPELQVQFITCFVRAPRVDMEREIFARGQPIFLPAIERLARLADDFELIVAEKPL